MLIGISGFAGVGKDTCADILVKDHGFVKVSFADPLKRICKDVFGFSDEQLWGPSSSRNAKDLRYPRLNHILVGGPGGGSVFRACAVCGGDGAEPCFLTPRYALRMLGSEWGRHCYDPVWVEYALNVCREVEKGAYYFPDKGAVQSAVRANKSTVIADVRFKNEIQALRKAGAVLIRVVRPSASKIFGAQHPSEAEQTEVPDSAFDEVIVNDRGIEDLARMLDAIVKERS